MTATFNCTMLTSTRILVSASCAMARLMEPTNTAKTTKTKRENCFAIAYFLPEPFGCTPDPDRFPVTRLSLYGGVQRHFRQQGNLAVTELITGFPHRAQHRRPILEVGGKNLLHHPIGQLRNQPVQHGWRITLF